MSIFKKKTVFWYMEYFVSIMFIIWTFKIITRKGATDLCQIYETELSEFVMLALIIPIFAGIILKKVSEYMDYSKILNMGSRCKWQNELTKQLIKISVQYSLILLLPMSLVTFIFSEDFRKWHEIIYFLFSCVMYATILLILALIIMEIKIQWNTDVFAVLSVLVIAFVPYIFSKVLIRNQIFTFSDFLNTSYAFENGKYLWMLHVLSCVITLVVWEVINKTVKWKIAKKDLLWRKSENEN